MARIVGYLKCKPFVQGRLVSHDTSIWNCNDNQAESCKLVTEIEAKSCSVLIWVQLVVKLFMEGFEDGSTIDNLTRQSL